MTSIKVQAEHTRVDILEKHIKAYLLNFHKLRVDKVEVVHKGEVLSRHSKLKTLNDMETEVMKARLEAGIVGHLDMFKTPSLEAYAE